MELGWYLRRLGNMSPAEMLHRVGEVQRKRASRRRSYGWDAFAAQGKLIPAPGLAEKLRQTATPQLQQAIRRAADFLLEGDFCAHGVAWPKRDAADLFPDDLWRLDPVTGGYWPGPELYCFDIPYRHERVLGDVKYVWDLNRLQFLQPLAAAVALWRDEKALAAIEAALQSWAGANPPFRGLAWNSGIELALRAVSVLFAVSLCGDLLSHQSQALAESILRAHFYWLARYPSRFSSANNHLVAEALGEFAVALALSDPRGVEKARQILEREARLQILDDGVGAEQSPTYAAFTAEMLLTAEMLGRAYGTPLGGEVGARLAAFVDWIVWMSDGKGRVPAIGDDDEGRVLALGVAREMAYPVSVARAVAGWLSLPAPPPSQDEAELRDAFFGPLPAQSDPQGVKTFGAGGYSIVRERRAGKKMRLTLDHGPLGYLSIAAHGHADANALTLSLDDEDIFVDPGTYLYHSGGAWRDWFRGTAAHNVLCLDGADQSVIAGPFNWSAKAEAHLLEKTEGDDWRLKASHDGYVARFGFVHEREISAHPSGVTILDLLIGDKTPPLAEVSFQAAPGLTFAKSGEGWTLNRVGKPLLTLTFSQPGESAIVSGGALGEGGWISPCFGTKQAAERLSWRGVVEKNGLLTRIDWA